MIPIWAKDRDGKWQVFPGHLLNPDGVTLEYDPISAWHGGSVDWEEFHRWQHLFSYDTHRRCYVLKKQLEPEEMSEKNLPSQTIL